ncbi:PfkB family carbohydrate kinase [Actinoplanes sp. NPDC051475]|uniref:PfkB family carbohydrate kinase n=1 Tax=Actinoplanes sp. NPDC051475 TaxID=3157225 RepID=UPI00344BC183
MTAGPPIDFGPHSGPAVCVVGSLNADLIAYESDNRIPGAYNVGRRFELGAGGKGLNVAMSVAATGLPSYLVGRVGDDMFGRFILAALTEGHVHADFVRTDPTAGTGIGHVRVNARRDYDTCVVPGANYNVGAGDTTSALDRRSDFSHVVMQFEIPLDTVADAARRFRAAGSQVVVNFSPVTAGARVVLPHTDVLVLNEAEAAALWQQVAGADGAAPGLEATTDVLRRSDGGPRDVVVTLGDRGLFGMSRTGEVRQYRAHAVSAVNAVGAGDSFLAMLVSRLAQGEPFLDGLTAAGAAGALACSRRESWLSRDDAPLLNDMVQNHSILVRPDARRA